MALKLAGEEIGIQEEIENIAYSPGLQGSGDLQTATRTITATSKQGTPDYTTSLTIPASPDWRLLVKQLCSRIQITIDSMTAAHLYGEVHLNGVKKMDLDFTTTGDQFQAVDIPSGFDIGSANEYKVYLWVDAGNTVISLVEIWQTIGTHVTSYAWDELIHINYLGFLALLRSHGRVGTGNNSQRLAKKGVYADKFYHESNTNGPLNVMNILSGNLAIVMKGTVDTDLNYVSSIYLTLRSLQ